MRRTVLRLGILFIFINFSCGSGESGNIENDPVTEVLTEPKDTQSTEQKSIEKTIAEPSEGDSKEKSGLVKPNPEHTDAVPSNLDIETDPISENNTKIKASKVSESIDLRLSQLKSTDRNGGFKYTFQKAEIRIAPDNPKAVEYDYYIDAGDNKGPQKNKKSLSFDDIGVYKVQILSQDKVPVDTQYVTVTYRWEVVQEALDDLIYHTREGNRAEVNQIKNRVKSFFSTRSSSVDLYKNNKLIDTYNNIQQFMVQLMAIPPIISDLANIESVQIEPNKQGEIIKLKIYYAN